MSALPIDRHFDCMKKCQAGGCGKTCIKFAYPRLRSALDRATNMRPALLMTLGYVPEPVLEYCNDVRATLEATK